VKHNINMKTCKICKKEKPLSDFHRIKKWYASYCKPCQKEFVREWRLQNIEEVLRKGKERYKLTTPEIRRRRKLMHRYGITMEDYEKKWNEQEGVCAICFKPEQGKKRFLSVDHCHKTDKVRGLLCDNCNNILGRAKDDYLILLSASTYLEEKNIAK
jgi:thiol-disulfide isomerase/thioredoxin